MVQILDFVSLQSLLSPDCRDPPSICKDQVFSKHILYKFIQYQINSLHFHENHPQQIHLV